jgi:hypothetical protein
MAKRKVGRRERNLPFAKKGDAAPTRGFGEMGKACIWIEDNLRARFPKPDRSVGIFPKSPANIVLVISPKLQEAFAADRVVASPEVGNPLCTFCRFQGEV